jgi:SNF2 family DNA or RNA helicase
VTIYRLVARHTIEEGIVDLHGHKRELADSLLDGSDMAVRMSADDMLQMLQEGMRR